MSIQASAIGLNLALALSAAGCGTKAGDARTTAFPTLSALHHEPLKRAEQLDSAAERPGAEQGQKTDREVTAETWAATAAAIVGSLFSKNANVVIGSGVPVDEMRLFDPHHAERRKLVDDERPSASEQPPPGACLLLLKTRPKSCDQPRETSEDRRPKTEDRRPSDR